MSETILCPQCEKRYSLPERPPATFTCRQCGALVDLSAFGGKDRPAAPSATPSAVPRGAGTRGGPSRRSDRQTGQPPTARESKPPVAAIVTILLVVIVLIAVRSGGDDPTPPKTARRPAATMPTSNITPSSDPERVSTREKRAATKTKVNADGSLKLRLSRVNLKRLEWPEGVTPGTRAQTEQAIHSMYAGGSDGRDAEEWLLAQGRPIAGRLISEFAAIRESPGFDNRDGASMAMQVDALLHKIDGFIERACQEDGKISSTGFYAGQSFITRTAKRWTWWWESGEWQSTPRKPWDPFEDESDDTPDGRKKTAPKDTDPKDTDPKKGRGFGKRAGSG